MKKPTALLIAIMPTAVLTSNTNIAFVNADWPMFRADPAHSGAGTGSPVLTPTQLWNYSTPGEPIYSSPMVANGVVFLGLHDGVYAFDAVNGSIIWKLKIYNPATPTVVDGVVYIGANYSINALNIATGQRLWVYNTNWLVQSPPTVANGIGGAPDTRFYALNATNGAQIWNLTLNDDVNTSPAVAGGIVYISVPGIDGYLHAVNATNGVELWTYKTYSGGSPTVANGMVYAGSVDDNFYALNASNGAKIWSFNASGTEASGLISGTSPAVQAS